MSIPESIQAIVSDLLSVKIKKFILASGGCINNGGEIIADANSYFLKWNSSSRFPGMFDAEMKGLQMLYDAACIRIPKPLYSGEIDNYQFIILEFINAGSRKLEFWEMLGERLAKLHRNTNDRFGLDQSNYIGSLPQLNKQHASWIEFFIEERLQKQLTLAVENELADSPLISKFEKLYKQLPNILPLEKPALLHGDLWSGNLLVDEKGEPCLIDPAVYYGNREAELSFTKLFGGFNESFYKRYNSEFPLTPGFDQRVDIYNLYPLLVHANLFGRSYISQIQSILKGF